MTTTVRILGSRAREQVPGTGITLLAPGFHGAITPIAAGAATHPAHALPFAAAAAAAEVMLAAQLSLHLEARAPPDGPELRSRSAATGHPKLIVPKRGGIAYALLDTDESGVSRLIAPESQDLDEAIFSLTISADRPTHRALRVFMWPAQQVLAPGVLAATTHWERLQRSNQFAQLSGNGAWRAPDWTMLARGPVLLLLHDTFATAETALAEWLGHASFARVLARYGGRCLACTQPTLTLTPTENAAWLAAHLPQRVEQLDIVAHGRGGLVARALATDGRIALRRAVLVGTPNLGTPLAAPGNVGRLLDGHVAMLARLGDSAALPTLGGALSLARFVALGMPVTLPGIEAMAPGSQFLVTLGAARDPAPQWFTVSAQFAAAGGAAADADEFAALPNDLVVPSDGCHHPGGPVADSLRIGGADVHHHNYFSNAYVRSRLEAWLA